MAIRFGNFASAKLATPPSGTTGLSFTVVAGKGSLFPTLAAGDWYYMVLRNAALVREVIKVEARSTDTFTIAAAGRGVDGSTAYASWAASDVVEICLTNAALLDALADAGRWVAAGGTADAITANYTPDIYALVDGQLCFVRAAAANATATPTFSPDGLTARTITQYGGAALEVGSIRGAGHELALRYNLASTRWELLNPEVGVNRATAKAVPVNADAVGFWDSVSGGLRKLTFANLATWIGTSVNALSATTATTATTATNTGGKTTIASAATPNIFATTVGTIIDYTGIATCTGFVAAPQAGATKRLICAGACLFTAGANLLIEGIASGNTITLAANAIVDVTAITTTQFKMTYSVSGAFTATGTGFAVNPTATARYKVQNGVANLFIPDMIGTSNATSFTITGLPAPIVPVLDTVIFPIMEGINSGAAVYVFGLINGGGSSIILSNGHSGLVWTATGTKQLSTNQFVYRVG